MGHIRKIAKVWAELHSQRDLGSSSQGPDSIDICLFDRAPGNIRLRRYSIDVELDRVSPRLSNLTCIADPTADGCAIETRDDWNFYIALRPPDVLKVRGRNFVQVLRER